MTTMCRKRQVQSDRRRAAPSNGREGLTGKGRRPIAWRIGSRLTTAFFGQWRCSVPADRGPMTSRRLLRCRNRPRSCSDRDGKLAEVGRLEAEIAKLAQQKQYREATEKALMCGRDL